MFGMGTPELVVILVVGLVILGPKRLPGLSKAIGKAIHEFKKTVNGMTTESESEPEQEQPQHARADRG